MTLRVAIYIFPAVEVLDFAGPFEVFTTATRVHARRHPGTAPLFETFTVAQSSAPITARAGLRTVPDYTLETAPAPDLLIMPGGVVDRELQNPQLLRWVLQVSQTAQVTASVCTGSFILAKAGLLKGKAATTHWEDIADLHAQFPELEVREGVRWVDEGPIITSAGIAAGIDMSLHLVSRFADSPLAKATAQQMDIPYRAAA